MRNAISTKEIYRLAKEVTEKEINNVLGSWELSEKKEDKKALDLFNSIVRLGDSRGVALFTAISRKEGEGESKI